MGNRSATGARMSAANDSAVTRTEGPSAFQRELDRARKHLAKLEAEDELRRQRPVFSQGDEHFDESPTLVRVCNAALWVIVLLPFALALAALLRRWI